MSDETGTHVPIEDLAAYAVGDLDATSAVPVEAHVLLCADCRGDLDALRTTAAALAAVPPVAMPPDVAARVDAALAAERSAGRGDAADAEDSEGPRPGATTVLPLRRGRRPALAGLSAAAGVAVLLVAVGLGLARSGGDRSQTGAAADRGTATRRILRTGIDYTSDRIGTVVPQLLAGRTPDVAAFTADGAGRNAGPTAGSAAPAPAQAELAAAEIGLQGAELTACLDALTAGGPPVEPLLLDYARYDDKPALVVVLPRLRNGTPVSGEVDVWVVGPRCSAGNADSYVFRRLRV